MAHKKEQKQTRVLNNRLPRPYLIRDKTIINFCFLPPRTMIFPTFIISIGLWLGSSSTVDWTLQMLEKIKTRKKSKALEYWKATVRYWILFLQCGLTVSSTFQDIDFDGSLPLFINWCYDHGIKKLPNHWWTRWYYFHDTIQGSKLRPIWSPMRLTFSPWRLKFLLSRQFGDLNFVWFRSTIKH